MIQHILLIIMAVIILPFVLPKAFLHIKRVRVEWKRINRLEAERSKERVTPLSMEHIMDTVGGLDKRVAVKILRDHVKTLKARIINYLPRTARVKIEDITELGMLRDAYKMLGLSMYVKPYSGNSHSTVYPTNPLNDVSVWRNYISTELNKMNTASEHTGFGQREKELLNMAIVRWMNSGFEPDDAKYFQEILKRDIDNNNKQSYARG